MAKISKLFLVAVILILVLAPGLVFAQEESKGLVPCATERNNKMCGFGDFMMLLNNIIDFIFKYLAFPISALMFAYAGFLMVTSAGSSESRTKAKNIFFDAVVGLVLAAGAWVIVKTLLSIMGYTEVDVFF